MGSRVHFARANHLSSLSSCLFPRGLFLSSSTADSFRPVQMIALIASPRTSAFSLTTANIYSLIRENIHLLDEKSRGCVEFDIKRSRFPSFINFFVFDTCFSSFAVISHFWMWNEFLLLNFDEYDFPIVFLTSFNCVHKFKNSFLTLMQKCFAKDLKKIPF